MKTHVSTLLGTAVLAIASASVLCEPAAAFDIDAKKIDAAAQRLVDEHRTPGLAIGVMRDGKIVYAKGFGLANLETGTKVTPDSAFIIGSITKQFTATAIVLLSEQGKLKIDDPLSKFFPDFPRGNEVTIRHLLTHTSGIHPIMSGSQPPYPSPAQQVALRTTDDVIGFIQRMPDLYDFDPGTSNRYSNSGYWLLGAIIEKVSGMSLAEFFKRNLFEPAGMTATALDDATEVVPNRVSGYARGEGAGVFKNPSPEYMGAAGGAGGIRSTVGDMLRWQDAFISGRIISAAAVKMMTTPREGFGVVAGNENGHASLGGTGGTTAGFVANQKMYPDDRVAFIVLSNMAAGGGGSGPRTQGPPPDGEGANNQGQRRRRGPPPEGAAPGEQRQGPRRRQGGPQTPASEVIELLSEMVVGPREQRQPPPDA